MASGVDLYYEPGRSRHSWFAVGNADIGFNSRHYMHHRVRYVKPQLTYATPLTSSRIGLVVTYTAYILLQFARRYPGVLSCVDCFRIIGGAPLAAVVGIGFVLNQIFGCSSAILTMSIALNSISEHAACTVTFILFPAIVSWMLCMPRRMKFSAHFGSRLSSVLCTSLRWLTHSKSLVRYPYSRQFLSS